MIEPDINERMARFAPSQNMGDPGDDAVERAVAGMAKMPARPQFEQDDAIDSAVLQIAGERKQDMAASLMAASQVNPDQAARASRLGDQFGVGQDIALRNMQELERESTVRDIQRMDLMRNDPVLARYLSDRAFASEAQDDVGILAKMRPLFMEAALVSALGPVPVLKRGFERGSITAERGDIGSKAMAGFATPADFDRVKQIEKEMRSLGEMGILGTTAEMVGQNVAQLRTIGTTAVAGAAAGSLVGPAGTVAGGALGATAGVIGSTASMEAGNLYLDLRNDGVSDETAIPTAIAGGFLNGVIEVVGMKIAAKPFQALAKRLMSEAVSDAIKKPTMRAALAAAGKGYLTQVGTEGAEEALQETVIIAGEEIAKAIDGVDNETGMREAVGRVLESFMYGAMGSSILGGIGPGANLLVDLRRASNTERQTKVFEDLATNRKESKYANRNPVGYERLLAAQAEEASKNGEDITTTYIRGDVATSILQQSGVPVKQLEDIVPNIRQQLAEIADGTRSDLTLPTATFGAKLAGTKLGDAFLPHVRIIPNGWSQAETAAWNQNKSEEIESARQILAQKQESDGTFVAEAREIYNDIRRQAMEAGQDSDTADVAASLYQAFVVTQAAGQNIKPAQFQAQQGVRGIEKIIGGMPVVQGEQAAQAAPVSAVPAVENLPRPPKPEGMEQEFYDALIARAIKNVGNAGTVDLTFGVRPEGSETDMPLRVEANLRAAGNNEAADVYIEMARRVADRNIAAFQERRAAEAAAPLDQPATVLEQAAMSTRVPSAVKPLEDALNDILLADFPAFLRDEKFVAKNLAKFKELNAPIRIDENATEQQQLEQIIDHMTSNLLWLHDAMEPAIRERARMWYVGGRRLVDWMAERHGMSPMGAATVFAVLSPQKNWYENVGLGIRITDIVATQGDTTMDADMQSAYLSSLRKEVTKKEGQLAKQDDAKPKRGKKALTEWEEKRTNLADELKAAQDKVAEAQGNIDAIGARTLAELLKEREFFLAAIMVRWFDQTKNDRTYPVISPEGGVGSPMLTEAGTPASIRYGSYNEVSKAIAAYVDGRAENVHYLIGGEHKVRNFYNNLFNPDDPRFATIDTHAIAAAYLMPLAGTDKLVQHGLGGGVGNAMFGMGGGYAVFYEAYRRAAEARGIQPREMQSITWEAIRGMFEAAMKSGLKAPVAATWKQYVEGNIDIDSARADVMQRAGGITTPSWVALPTDMQPAAGYEGVSRTAADEQAQRIAAQTTAASVMFEVAPDPVDTALVKRWESLSPQQRQAISVRVAEDIIPRILQEYGVAADMVMQVGGWEGATNVGFALRMPPGPLVRQIAQSVGYALSQQAVFTLSATEFQGSERADIIVLQLQPGTTVDQIGDLYEKMLYPLGIQGHATVQDSMIISLDPGVDGAILANTISQAAAGDGRIVEITHATGWRSLDDTRITEDTARATDEGRRAEGVAGRRRIDAYRREATRLVAEYLGDQGRFQQAAAGPAFFSALEREVGAIDSKALTAAGWGERLTGLVNKGAIKAEELEWSGLLDYLKMQEGKVSKDTVLEFLRGNGVKVEIIIGGNARNELDVAEQRGINRAESVLREYGMWTEDMAKVFAEYRAMMPFRDGNYDLDKRQELFIKIDDALNQANGTGIDYYIESEYDQVSSDTGRYKQYTLPGGTNYREVLLTLPSIPNAPEFTSSHWNQRNVLVHLRMNDRVDADGKRVLFVEEVQSDWGQAGVKRGFVNQRAADEAELADLSKQQEANPTDARKKQIARIQERLTKDEYNIARAPYVETTDGWLNLGLKQIMLEAVRGGYDRVAFVTGEQSADRYNLSNQVSRVVYQDNYSGGVSVKLEGPPTAGRIIAYNKQGQPVVNQPVETPDELENIVGKEVAQRLLDARPQPGNYAGLGARQRELSGLDLKVGGEGMQDFYNKIVPTAMGKLLKKYGGEKLQITKLQMRDTLASKGIILADEKIRSVATEYINGEIDAEQVIDGLGLFDKNVLFEKDVIKYLGNIDPTNQTAVNKAIEKFNEFLRTDDSTTNQPGFDITPELVKKLESGLPLFQAMPAAGPARGGFDPSRLAILLNSSSDRTTLWHEFVHFFLHMYTEAAVSGRASERQLNDLDLLLKWFKIEGNTPAERLANWNAMTLDQKRKHHEALTYNAEIYAFEGKAPSAELVPVFERLRAFMLRVYKSIRDDLNAIYRREFGEDLPILTGEVRQVMDRMLATDEQIKRQAAINEMKPQFQTQEQSGMDDAEWAAYQAMQQEAIEASVTDMNKASMRQLQWLGNARSRILRDMQRKHEAKRKEVAAEVAAAVRVEPLYRAMTYLRTGKFIDTDGAEVVVEGPHRLDIKRVQAIYAGLPSEKDMEAVRATGQAMPKVFAPDIAKLGTGKYGMLGVDGLDPDVVAESFGYSSGDQMIRALLEAKPIKEAVAERTDAEMLRQYGDMNTPEAQEAEVQKALHNEARARFVAVELRHIARATQPVRVMLEAAKQVARELIAGMTLRDVRPGDFIAAEARAARDASRMGATVNPEAVGRAAYTRTYNERIAAGADEATAVAEATTAATEAARKAQERSDALKAQYGADPQQALIRAKRAQLYQNQLAAQALVVREEVAKQIKYLRRIMRDTNVKAMGAQAADQIAALLERFEVAPVSLKRLDERKALAAWLAEQEAAGLVPDIAPEVADEARRVNYQQLTVTEFRNLVDAIRQIEFIGKNERKVQLAAERAAFEEKRDEIVTRIRAVGRLRGVKFDPRSPLTNIGRSAAALRGFAAQHLKAASVARILDGGEDDGPLWQFIIRSANAAADMETRMRAEASAKIAEILAPVFKLGNMGGKGVFFPSIKRSLNREARIAIAMNVGNDGNRQRLLDGEGWTMEQIQPILESLTEAEWNAVQQVWDYIDTYRPLIAEKERRLYGKEPQWVTPVPMSVRTADGKTVNLTGGYYPIKYDPIASDRVATVDEAAEAKRALDGAYTAATTRRSFTKQRAKEVVGRPLLYTLDAAFGGINDVIHDLSWHEWLIQTQRLLRDPEFANAVRETRGPEFLKQLRDWAKDNAAGERKIGVAGEAALSWLRQGISASGLGFNVVSAAMQVTGFNQSIVRLGAKYVGRGVAQFATSPIDTARMVADKSSFMAERGRTQFREINEIRNRVRGQTEVARRVTAGTYFLMMNMQRTVDIPTWLAGYQKALDAGKDDATAVALADQAVRDTQGSGLISDLAAIERGGPMMKLFTVFYSYMNTVYNMTAVQTMTARGKGKLAADYAMLLVVPVVLGQAIKNLIQPDAGDDELDPEALARKLAAEELSFLMGTMVIAREFGGAAQLLTGAEGVRMGYGGPAGLRAVGEVYGLATQAGQLDFDRAFRRSAINTLGAFTGLPSAQVNRTIDGIEAVIEGEVEGVGAVVAPLTGVQR